MAPLSWDVVTAYLRQHGREKGVCCRSQGHDEQRQRLSPTHLKAHKVDQQLQALDPGSVAAHRLQCLMSGILTQEASCTLQNEKSWIYLRRQYMGIMQQCVLMDM